MDSPLRKSNKLLDIVCSILLQGCGATYSAENGFLTSPFYPSHYPPGTECTYLISLPFGTHISIQPITFDIDCSQSDRLEVRDGDNAQSSIIGIFCGSDTNDLPSLQTTQSHLWLKFTSSNLGRGIGFKISYSFIYHFTV